MYFSITFVNTSGQRRNTWDDWHLIPSAPPMIEAPEPYTNYVEIPGRIEGPIDLSETLTGGPSFQNSEGSWQFYLAEGFYSRMEMYHQLKSFLHGKRMKIIFEEDSSHYYYGRLTVSMPETGDSGTSFEIGYNVRPVRYKLNGTKDGI
jgi:hypothetical protein